MLIGLWLSAGILTLLTVDDVKVLKINYLLMWICLMVNLIDKYFFSV